MTKIAVILCYFGKLPENFSLFAESCRRNATIDFLLFTDDTPTHQRQKRTGIRGEFSASDFPFFFPGADEK